MKNLSSLDLRSNKITDISFLKELKNLSSLYLYNNPIQIPPERIWKDGIAAIQNYFKQISEQGAGYLYEAKIILVGEPGAGKTSLLKKIKDPNYIIPNRDEKETIGIQVEIVNFPHPNMTEVNFRANIWDFGGQDIQHTIHQFFLTADALYLLIVDDRKENTDYDYWFNIIKVLGEESPVVVILNEVNKLGPQNFDYLQYKKRYSDLIIEKRDVDLSVNDGRLEELLERIKLSVTQLKGIGTPLPKQWIPIRQNLEELVQKNHITYNDFIEICQKNELSETNDQEFLAQTFHRIGVFLHFCNDPNLAGTIFTNHKWVVDSLYTVLKDKSLRETNGLFEKRKIFELWGEKYKKNEKNQLLSLMLKNNFDICYKVEGHKEEKYLFPVLLPPEKPDFVLRWDFTNNLRFRFQYKFMPKGIITRLIVRLSDFIYDSEGKNIVWRTGAVLKKGDSFAVISEDLDRQGLKVIDLAVSGRDYDKRDFLIIIKNEIKRIHETTFNNLPVNEMVPCECKECLNSQEPNFFDNKELEKYRTNNVSKIRCNKSTYLEEVDVKKLIEGYENIKKVHLEEREHNFLQPTQQLLPEITILKESDPWYRKWYYISGLALAIVAITWYSIDIVNSWSPKEPIQPNTVPPKSIEQVKQDSTKNAIKDSSANKKNNANK
ncbi:MAG: COR domain-containing protein [Melioribacteraceae bacterium]|nr:COR domain-containing protein [Melioribacteraceae bacterium]